MENGAESVHAITKIQSYNEQSVRMFDMSAHANDSRQKGRFAHATRDQYVH